MDSILWNANPLGLANYPLHSLKLGSAEWKAGPCSKRAAGVPDTAFKVPGSQMSQKDALLAKSGLTKAIPPIVAMLAATLALAWGGGRSSSLHQVMLQQ